MGLFEYLRGGSNSTQVATTSQRSKSMRMHLQPIKCKVMNTRSRYIAAVMICLWHPLQGPVRLAVWHGKEELPESVLEDIGRQTLLGEMTQLEYQQSAQKAAFDLKMNLLPHLGVVVQTVLFSASKPVPGDAGYLREQLTTKYGLSLIVNHKHLSALSSLSSSVSDRIHKLGLQLHFCLTQYVNDTDSIKRFDHHLNGFLNHFDVWMSAYTTTPTSISIQDTMFGLIGRKNDTEELGKEGRDFFQQVLTAFLEAHCHAVLQCDNMEILTMWFKTLSILLSEKERRLTLPPNQHQSKFIPELRLQGLPTSVSCSTEELLYSQAPVTVINLNTMDIRICLQCNMFTAVRDRFFCPESEDTPTELQWGLVQSLNIAQSRRPVAPMVRAMVDRCSLTPLCLREGFIQNWRKQITMKAASLAEFVVRINSNLMLPPTSPIIEKEGRPSTESRSPESGSPELLPNNTSRLPNRPRSLSDCSILDFPNSFTPEMMESNFPRNYKFQMKKWWQDEDIVNADDQRIILSLADQLHPGIRKLYPGGELVYKIGKVLTGLEEF